MNCPTRSLMARPRPATLAAALLAGALLVASGAAAAPTTLALQGALTSAGGGPVSDGTYGLSVSIWDAAQDGQSLYGENIVGAQVSGGSLHVVLGADKQVLDEAVFATGQALWIELAIDGQPPLPRVAVRPVPRALHAVHATHAATAGSAQQADKAALADKATNADQATNADKATLATTAENAIAADEALVANQALALQCTGCVGAAMLGPDVAQGLVDAGQLAKVATTGAYADLSGGPDLSGYGALTANQTWSGDNTFGKAVQATAGVVFGGTQAFAMRLHNATEAPLPCSAATTGLVWYDTSGDALMVCNGTKYRVFAKATAIGSEQSPGLSCADVLAQEPGSPDGLYWIAPKADQKWQAYCDMTTDGGGWTRILRLTSSGAYQSIASVPNSQEVVDNGSWQFSKTLLKDSNRELLYLEAVAPFRRHRYDFKQGSNVAGEDFVGAVTGDVNANVAAWNYATSSWQLTGAGGCNSNNHTQWNCEPPSGVRFHHGTRDWTGDGGSNGSGWNFTGYATGGSSNKNPAPLIANFNGQYNATAHDLFVR